MDAGGGAADAAPVDAARADAAPADAQVPAGAAAVSWRSTYAWLEAAEFWLIVDGQRYEARDPKLDINSTMDNGQGTLELIWTERGKEMRVNFYFASDAASWWCNELRNYNGLDPVDWDFYTGTFFRSKLGVPFEGDVDLMNNGPDDKVRSSIHFRGLKLLALVGK